MSLHHWNINGMDKRVLCVVGDQLDIEFGENYRFSSSRKCVMASLAHFAGSMFFFFFFFF
jgi:uncharacterized protein affecting Mg2+/Co2+ transport